MKYNGILRETLTKMSPQKASNNQRLIFLIRYYFSLLQRLQRCRPSLLFQVQKKSSFFIANQKLFKIENLTPKSSMVNELNTTSLVEIKILSNREFEAERCVTGTFLSLSSICSFRSNVSSAIPKSIKDRPRNKKKESKQLF